MAYYVKRLHVGRGPPASLRKEETSETDIRFDLLIVEIRRGESKTSGQLLKRRRKERQGSEHYKDSDGGGAGSKLMEKIGALCRNTECQKKLEIVAAPPAKLRKVAASNPRRAAVKRNNHEEKDRCMRNSKKRNCCARICGMEENFLRSRAQCWCG